MLLDRLSAYENGELHFHQVIELFQSLIDAGTIIHLEGQYGRQAQRLIDAGYCNY